MANSFPKSVLTRSVEMRNFFNAFLHNESIGGVLLLVCTIIALVGANVDCFGWLPSLWHTVASLNIGSFSIEMTLEAWINDALMAVFFFVVGLEIKREMLVGELSSFKHAALPILAALGGMIVPAIIYTCFNYSHEETFNGWGIPMATDIAFAIGVLSLLGKRAPMSLKIFLTALAIVDDLGAIIVLAIFYPTHGIDFQMLLYAFIVVLFLLALGRLGVRNLLAYVIPGLLLWWLIWKSGIHATISGVILAMTIPSRTTINEVRFISGLKCLLAKFREASNSGGVVLANPRQQHIINQIHRNVVKINPLMHRFEFALHPWVTFFIMPVFALANAGVVIDTAAFQMPVPAVVPGIFFGLLLGKPIGIFLFSFLAVKARIAVLPEGIKWKQVFALGIVAGIGFTMSVFIDNLAFPNNKEIINIGKITILATSFVAALAGMLAIVITSPAKRVEN